MENKKIFVLFLLFLTFININASSLDNYDTSIRSANKYINTNEVHKLYFINGDNMFFGFNNKKIIRDTKFTSGGLLNIDEYDISHYENKTYLNGINNYWTMNYSDYNAYKIDLQKYNVLRNERSKTRVTEYVYKETKVSGSGTYKDPWIFPNMYLVEVESTDNNRGRIIESRKYVLDSKDVSFEVAPMEGYTYESNTCNTTEASDYGLNIRNVKQNIKCSVSFKPKTYTITYDNNGGSGCTNKNITFNSTYGELCTPTRAGYTFVGWFTDVSGGNEVTSLTVLTSASNQTIYAHWTPNNYTLTYNNNGGGGCTNKQIIFNSAYGTLCTPTKSGYSFQGWYTSASGGTKVTSSTVLTSAGNKTIYARWKANQITCADLNNLIQCNTTNKGKILNYTGSCEYVCDNVTTNNWRVKFLTSGTLYVSASQNIDVFLVGGGAGGTGGGGGYGGSGGRTATYKNITINDNTSYAITIGAGGTAGGGTGGTTSAFGKSAAGGTTSSGGSGGGGPASYMLPLHPGGSYGNNGSNGGSGQGTTTCEFGEGTLSGCTLGDNYAYAGGGGGCGANTAIDSWATSPGGKGGGGNSGSGGNYNYQGMLGSGQAGTDNRGGGGGYGSTGGRGGSGVVVIRNKR